MYMYLQIYRNYIGVFLFKGSLQVGALNLVLINKNFQPIPFLILCSFNFIRWTVRNVQKTVQHKLSWVMVLCLYYVACAENLCPRAITSR